MRRAAAARWLVALVVVLGVWVLGAAPAGAASPAPSGPSAVGEVPPQVRAAYDGDFLRQMVTSTQGQVGEVRAGTVHQLFSFTEDFMAGDPAADPVEAGDGWIAGVEADGVPVGWQRTFLDDDGTVRSSGWNPDPVGARAFLATDAGALVEVPWDNAFFTLVDGVVTPVEVQSWDAGLGPRDLAQVQADFAVSRAETEAAYACCRPSDGCAGGGAAVGGSGGGGDSEASCASALPSPGVLAFASLAVLLAGAVVATVLGQRRRERRLSYR